MNIFRALKLPDFLSMANALLGMGAMMMAWKGSLQLAVLLVLLAAVTDGLDGFLARRMDRGVLGKDLDSLADLISFGSAPVLLAFALDRSWTTGTAGGIYLTSGILRLARFNQSLPDDRFFEGLPITVAGVVLSLGLLLERPELISLLMLFLSGLMVSSIPYPKLRDSRRWPLALLVGLAAAFLGRQAGIEGVAQVFFLCFFVYLIAPVVTWLQRKERLPPSRRE
jgi:CDP-diacylglycerol--serine O-phosphatidyltransferase